MWSFIKICLICIIVIYRLKEKFHKKTLEYMWNYSLPCSCSYNLSSFWLALKQQWTIKVPFKNVFDSPHPPFKMAAVTKNRNFFNYPLHCNLLNWSYLSFIFCVIALQSIKLELPLFFIFSRLHCTLLN
jgi:hypothetical protein